jgi:hypothetical protein
LRVQPVPLTCSRPRSAWRFNGKRLRGVRRLGWLLAASLSCRGGCGSGEAPQGEPLELLRRVTSPPEATPAWIDIDEASPVFLVAAMRGPVQLWSEAPSEAANAAAIPADGVVLAARFTPAGLFVALEQGRVALWSAREARALYDHDFGRRARRAVISADGRFVGFGGSALAVASNRELGEPKPLASQSSLAFSANGARLVSTGFHEPWIVVRDLPSGAVREWLAPRKVSHAALSPAADVVAAAMDDGAIHFWRQPGGEALGEWQGRGEIRALCFSSGAASLVVADDAGLSVVDVAHTRETWRAHVEGNLWTFACDGDLAAAGTTSGELWLWDLAREVLRARLALAATAVVALDVSAARHRLAAADEKGEVGIWGWR